jgi:hypothetical protein
VCVWERERQRSRNFNIERTGHRIGLLQL